MTTINELLATLSPPHWYGGNPATAAELAALVAKWPSLPDDYRDAMSAGGGELVGDNAKITLFNPRHVLRFNDPADQGRSMLVDMMLIGVDAGDYWYFFDPAGKLGRGAWALFLVDKATDELDPVIFAAPTLLGLIERLFAGDSPINDDPEP